MVNILRYTPIWVYGLFVVLLIFGFMQTRNRYVNRNLGLLLPFAMIILAFVGVITSFGLSFANLGCWIIGMTGIAVGLSRFVDMDGLIYYADRRTFFIPGSWLSFTMIMVIFFTKYTVGVMTGLAVQMQPAEVFAMGISLLYGCYSGYFAYRLVKLYQVRFASNR